MKRGDMVVPTWKKRGEEDIQLNSVELGIVLDTKPANANKYTLISVKVAIVCNDQWSDQKAFVPKWYHCSHWMKVNESR